MELKEERKEEEDGDMDISPRASKKLRTTAAAFSTPAEGDASRGAIPGKGKIAGHLRALQRAGSAAAPAAASDWEAVFHNIDIDGDGLISLDELQMTFVRYKLVAKEERLYNAFLEFDLDRSVSLRLVGWDCFRSSHV